MLKKEAEAEAEVRSPLGERRKEKGERRKEKGEGGRERERRYSAEAEAEADASRAITPLTVAPRLRLRVRGSLFVGSVVGASHELQLGLRLIVPLPEQGQPIVHP